MTTDRKPANESSFDSGVEPEITETLDTNNKSLT